jgi:hypothetical protein
MPRLLLALALACIAAGAHAQKPDPLKSPACIETRQRLQELVAQAKPGDPDDAERLSLAREGMAIACFGRKQGQRERSGVPVPAQVVAPPALSTPRPIAGPMPSTAPPSPLYTPGPAAVTACDPGGCWDNQGHRLNNIGPLLIGPRGPCTVQAGMVVCP